jgi:uncharacterized membrane protein YhaH (DUF805 family)
MIGWLLFSFDGRLDRTHYRLCRIVANVLFLGILSALRDNSRHFLTGMAMPLLFSFLIFATVGLMVWTTLAMQVKRRHDRDKSWPWLFVGFIPIVGPLWVLIETCWLNGTPGYNRFDDRSPSTSAGGPRPSVLTGYLVALAIGLGLLALTAALAVVLLQPVRAPTALPTPASQPAAAPTTDPPIPGWVQMYPGGAVRSVSYHELLGRSFWRIEFTTKDTPEQMRAFYQQVAAERGFDAPDSLSALVTFKKDDGNERFDYMVFPQGDANLVLLDVSAPDAASQ